MKSPQNPQAPKSASPLSETSGCRDSGLGALGNRMDRMEELTVEGLRVPVVQGGVRS